MKVISLDRIVVMVKDMDKALEFFSNVLGLEFKELADDISRRDGVRSYVCHKIHLHLISPILPLPENAAPPMKKRVTFLEKNEAIINALTFIVADPIKAASKLEKQGVFMQQHRYEISHDYSSIGLDNFSEVMTVEEYSLGLVIGLANYN